MTARVGCAVLAAGASRRLGRPKQLLMDRGRALVVAAAEAVCESRASACAVVIGAAAEAVRASLVQCPVEIVENPDWDEGMASSIRAAALWATRTRQDALILTLCDQPKLSAQHVNQLIDQYRVHHLPVASHYARKNAVPALFPSAHFAALLALRGDTGASALLNDGSTLVQIPWPEGAFDLDTLDAYRSWQADCFRPL
jgi:CTP:molybdopterin cytidylyltransferase MocA